MQREYRFDLACGFLKLVSLVSRTRTEELAIRVHRSEWKLDGCELWLFHSLAKGGFDHSIARQGEVETSSNRLVDRPTFHASISYMDLEDKKSQSAQKWMPGPTSHRAEADSDDDLGIPRFRHKTLMQRQQTAEPPAIR